LRQAFIQEHDVGTDHRSFSEGSRLEDYDISQDTIVNYIGTHYVRVLKRFEAPADYREGTHEYKLIKPNYTKRFHLRYYIPKSTLIRKAERVRQIVIMFNGLNEVDRFDLYDVLGEHLAEQGIAAVLLPTPYHLNRSPRRKSETPREPPHVALFNNPMLMYYNYKQSMRETALLIRKLRQEKTARDKNDFGFYESLFDPKLQVSILGFSLGGLRALASFILDPEQYHACIVFNSGVNLTKLNTERINIDKGDWEKFVKRLRSDARKYSDVAGPENTAKKARGKRSVPSLWDTFKMVFLGTDPPELSTSLMDNSDQLLLILSGADTTMPRDTSEIEVPGYGLNVFRIAGVGHIPTLDDKWSFWIDRVSELIVGFIGQAGQDLWSRQGIVSEVKSALKDPDYASRQVKAKPDAGTPQLGELLNQVEPGKRKEVINAYYAGMAYYPRFRDVLKEVVKSFEHTNEAKRKATALAQLARPPIAKRSRPASAKRSRPAGPKR